MADKLIETTAPSWDQARSVPGDNPMIVQENDPDTIYFFYPEVFKIMFRKTIDGGNTWMAEQQVDPGGEPQYHFGLWYDGWTAHHNANFDNKIHVAWTTTDDDKLHYAQLDTNESEDTYSQGPMVVDDDVGTIPETHDRVFLRVCRAHGGRLFIAYINAGEDFGAPSWSRAYYSDDDGASWTEIGVVITADLEDHDQMMLSPGPEDNTCWVFRVVVDGGSGSVFADYLGSTVWVNLYTVASIGDPKSGSDYLMISATQHHLSGSTFVVFNNDNPTGGANSILCYRLDGWGDTPALLSTVMSGGGGLFCLSPHIFCEQNTGQLYCAFLLGINVAAATHPYSRISYDYGSNWSGAVQYDGAGWNGWKWVQGPRCTQYKRNGCYPLVYPDDAAREFWSIYPYLQFVAQGYTVRETLQGGSDLGMVECETGNPPEIPGPTTNPEWATVIDKDHISQSATGLTNETPNVGQSAMLLYDEPLQGTPQMGEIVRGQTSGALGYFDSVLTDPHRILLSSPQNGPGPGNGTPFQAGETLTFEISGATAVVADGAQSGLLPGAWYGTTELGYMTKGV